MSLNDGYDHTKYDLVKPIEATHVYEPTIGVKALPCAHPRSMLLRWLKERPAPTTPEILPGPATNAHCPPEGTLLAELTSVLNRYSAENASNTPDFILANYLMTCLVNFNVAVQSRDQWYGVDLRPGADPTPNRGKGFEGLAADVANSAPERSYEYRSQYACKVCGNVPDNDGRLEHGKGCYTQSEDGGRESYVEFDDEVPDGKVGVSAEWCDRHNLRIARTQEEFVAKLTATSEMPFDFSGEVASEFLDWEHVKPLLTEEALAKYDSGEEKFTYWDTPQKAAQSFLDYLEFASGKAQDQRGLSAIRSIQKLSCWMWALGRDDLAELLNDDDLYNPYGAPALIACSERLGIPIPLSLIEFAKVKAEA